MLPAICYMLIHAFQQFDLYPHIRFTFSATCLQYVCLSVNIKSEFIYRSYTLTWIDTPNILQFKLLNGVISSRRIKFYDRILQEKANKKFRRNDEKQFMYIVYVVCGETKEGQKRINSRIFARHC